MLLSCENPAASQIVSVFQEKASVGLKTRHPHAEVVRRLLCACRWSRLVFWKCALNCDIKVVIVHLSWGHALS